MASRARLSYQRLRKLSVDDTDVDQKDVAGAAATARAPGAGLQPADQTAVQRSKKLHAWRAAARSSGRWLRRLRWRRRPRVRVAGLIRRLLQGGSAKVTIRSVVAKVVKRLKEGEPYLGELFAGNYMFMQVSPSPTMACADKYSLPTRLPPAGGGGTGGRHCHHTYGGVCTAPPSTGFSIPRK